MEPLNFSDNRHRGRWAVGNTPPAMGAEAIKAALRRVNEPIYLLDLDGRLGVGRGGMLWMGNGSTKTQGGYTVSAYAPALDPGNLGDKVFKSAHGLSYAYVAGAMANGITSVEMVEAMGKAGMIGFFGAAGLLPAEIEDAVCRLQNTMADLPYGFNLIHSPYDAELEMATVQLYLQKGVKRVSASAFLGLTLPLIYYRVKGIGRTAEGQIACPNHVVAKVSRVEVARKFLAPPPLKMLQILVERRLISQEEARLAEHVPVADDLTAEADSGGHTDNRPAIALLPTMLALRDEMMIRHGYHRPLCVGLAGGISTPAAATAAFAMGADYVLTGSVNQACIESGTSEAVRKILAEADQADVTMAPAADMFEMGVKVQVLKRGTMFPQRAAKLYELYHRHGALEEIPAAQRTLLEREFFRCSFEEEWQQTRSFFTIRDPKQIEKAEKNPKHKMALVFRSYLGRSSKWANSGESSRQLDYQIWCGPSMGAFNQWARGSFLEVPHNRDVVTVAMNLLYGAVIMTRASWLRSQGAILPAESDRYSPLSLSEIRQMLDYT